MNYPKPIYSLNQEIVKSQNVEIFNLLRKETADDKLFFF
jgi:hypothetical protein